MKTHSLTAPMTFGIDEMVQPTEADLGPNEVLLKSIVGGICGSDLPYFRGLTMRWSDQANPGFISKPGSPMHEILGEVVATTDPRHKVGDRVVGWSTAYEGLRPYLIVPGNHLGQYDPQWEPQVAINLQPLACIIYAVNRLGDLRGRNVAVLGMGPIGAMFAQLTKEAGAARVVGVDPVDHAETSKTFKADEFLQLTARMWAEQISDADRPDVVIEAVGHNTLTVNDAISGVAPEGLVFAFGVPDEESRAFDFSTFQHKDLTLKSGLTRHHRDTLASADEYLRRSPELARALTTDVLGFDEVQKAYDRANTPQTGRLKVVLTR